MFFEATRIHPEGCLDWRLPPSLLQLERQGEAGLVNDVLAMFGSDTTVRLRRMRDAFEGNDFRELRQQAHTLKGSTRQVGADRMASLCLQIELLTAGGGGSEARGLLTDLNREFAGIWPRMATRFGGGE